MMRPRLAAVSGQIYRKLDLAQRRGSMWRRREDGFNVTLVPHGNTYKRAASTTACHCRDMVEYGANLGPKWKP